VGDEFGVNVYYHNHTGGVGETRTQVDQILAGLDPMHRHVMLDVGHATKDFAELPPTERATSFLERYWGEIEYLEFKDWNETTDLNTPLGEGYADYERILSLVADGNFSGWIVVEQNGNEGLSLGRGPAECGRVSRQFLRQHGL
jgi:sugar phosphate isomerase/epimerase